MTFRGILCSALALALLGAIPAQAQSASYDGLKKTVSVDTFQLPETLGQAGTAEGLTAMLTQALVKDGRFVVVERPALAGIQAEQALAAAGATAETAARPGQLIGASAMVRGTVTKYEPVASGSSVNIGLPLGSLFGARAGMSNQKGVMEITLRLVDTSTGQVISTSTAKGEASSSTTNAGLSDNFSGASLGGSTFHTTPIGQAAQDAIVKAVELIAAGMRSVPWSALVVDESAGRIYVNAGADRNVQAGMILNAYRKGKVFTDPSTGVVLDVEMTKIGTIRIDSVREKLSTAVLVDGALPARSDTLKQN